MASTAPIAKITLPFAHNSRMTLEIPNDERDAAIGVLTGISEELGAMVSEALIVLDAHKAA